MIITRWARYGELYRCELGNYVLQATDPAICHGNTAKHGEIKYCGCVFLRDAVIDTLLASKVETAAEARDWCEEVMLAHAAKNGIELDGVT